MRIYVAAKHLLDESVIVLNWMRSSGRGSFALSIRHFDIDYLIRLEVLCTLTTAQNDGS